MESGNPAKLLLQHVPLLCDRCQTTQPYSSAVASQSAEAHAAACSCRCTDMLGHGVVGCGKCMRMREGSKSMLQYRLTSGADLHKPAACISS